MAALYVSQRHSEHDWLSQCYTYPQTRDQRLPERLAHYMFGVNQTFEAAVLDTQVTGKIDLMGCQLWPGNIRLPYGIIGGKWKSIRKYYKAIRGKMLLKTDVILC